MKRILTLGFSLFLAGAVAQADTLVLRDGRQYSGIVTKTGRGYIVFKGTRQFSFTDDQVQDWVKGDAPPEKSAVKPVGSHPVALRPKKGDPKTVDALQRHGHDALGAGAYRVARNAYFDLLLLDPADPLAQEGAGLAYLGLGDGPRGKQFLESALSNAGASSRSIALNAALANLRTKNPVRTAKIIRDLLTETGAEDTRALDLLSLALAQTDGPAKKTRVYEEARKFAAEYEATLQEKHPGLKRWGAEWLTPSEVESREREQKSDQASLKAVEAELAEQKRAIAKADTDLAAMELKQLHGVNVGAAIERQKREVDRLREAATGIELRLTAVRGTAMSASASALALEPLLPGDETAPAVAVAQAPPAVIPPTATPATPPTPAPSDPTPAAPSPTPSAVSPPVVAVSTGPTPPVDPPRHREVVDYAAGFAVAPDLIVTDALSVENATMIRLQAGDGAPIDARVLRTNEETGLALLRVEGGHLPYVMLDGKFAGGAIICVSYPSVDLFDPSAELISGSAATPGPNWTAQLSRHPRLGGGPLVDAHGRVIGIELAARDSSIGKIRAVATKDILQLLGPDAPATLGWARATDAILQVTATHEK